MALCTVSAALSLAACATPTPPPEPTIVTRTVNIPVVMPCRPELSQKPDLPATPVAILTGPDIFARTKLVVAELLLLRAENAELRAAHDACAK